MNPNNCTLEMARKLVEAGIVLETEKYHRYWQGKIPGTEHDIGSELVDKKEMVALQNKANSPCDSDSYEVSYVPAPSMAEVWRELFKELKDEKNIVYAIQEADEWNSQGADVAILCVEVCSNVEKLCELLIWVKREEVMRKVMVSEYVLIEGKWELKEKGTATFHRFGVNYEQLDMGVGIYSTAVIEWPNGRVGNVPIEHIRFVTED